MKKLGVFLIIAGIIVSAFFFAAAARLSESGEAMKYLRSQAGTSLAEAYYQEVGAMSNGFGAMNAGFGLFSLFSFSGSGIYLIIKGSKKENLDFTTIIDSPVVENIEPEEQETL